jgi:hypothetical protein
MQLGLSAIPLDPVRFIRAVKKTEQLTRIPHQPQDPAQLVWAVNEIGQLDDVVASPFSLARRLSGVLT